MITPGSVQGSEGMYAWLARTSPSGATSCSIYDVQGEGTSETLPHTTGGAAAVLQSFAAPVDGNLLGCPGVPFQQIANFTTGTEDALDWFLSPRRTRTPHSWTGLRTTAGDPGQDHQGRDHRPLAGRLRGVRRSRRRPPGRGRGGPGQAGRPSDTSGIGAIADPGQHAHGPGARGAVGVRLRRDAVPPRRRQLVRPGPSRHGPDPMRERRTGFEDWAAAGVDTMLVVPRALDPPGVHRHSLRAAGEPLRPGARPVCTCRPGSTSYLKHRDATAGCSATSMHLPGAAWSVASGRRSPSTATSTLSFYYCSAYAFHAAGLGPRGRRRAARDWERCAG